jgi:DNA-directed RNA polymerase specialized sigma24 family protein
MGAENDHGQLSVVLLQCRHRQTFEALYNRYSPLLNGEILKTIHDEKLAAEILETTFLTIYRNISEYRPEEMRLFTWLLQITRQTMIAANV